MMTRKARRVLIIVPTVIVCLTIIAIFALLYLNTDMFKSSKTLFFKYMGTNAQNLRMAQEIFQNAENVNSSEVSKYIEDSEIKVNYTKNIGTTSESTDNSINKLKLKIEGQVDNQNEYKYKDAKIIKENEQILEVEYINNENISGIRFTDLFKQFLLAENTNIKDLLKDMGYDQEKIESITDMTDLDENIFNGLDFSDEEIENLKEKYLDLIKKDLSNARFESIQRQNISIDGRNVEVDGYVAKISKEQLNNIYIDILKNMKQDEIIFGKIDILQEKINPINLISSEQIDIKSNIISTIEDKINEIEKNNIGNEETKIIVYKNQGRAVRTTIQGVDYELNLDCLQTVEGRFVEYTEKQTDEETNKFTITIKKEINEIDIQIENNKNNKLWTLGINQNTEQTEDENIRKVTIEYKKDNNKLEANISKNIEIVEELEDNIEQNNENSIQLDKLEEEQLKAITNVINDGVKVKWEEIGREDIKAEDMQEILNQIGLYYNRKKLEGEGVSEAAKNRYNSKYELLQGEEIESERAIGIIETIKDDLINIQTVSGQEIKIEINPGQGDNELVQTLEDFMKKNKNIRYTISIEYDDSGLAKYISLKLTKGT